MNIKQESRFWPILSSLIPKTEFGDYVFSTLKFLRVHQRFPSKKSQLFNDILFYTKSSREIDDPLRVFVTDKEYFKLFVAAVAGEKYTVPTYAVLRSEDDIDRYDFPEQFCAKPTHMSGIISIVSNGVVNKDEYKRWLTLNHYPASRERNYLRLTPKVIVEPIIFGQTDITDFRVFCYNGKPKLICLDIGKYSNYRRAFYTVEWEKQDYSLGYPGYEMSIDRPANLDEMLLIAERLSKWLSFVRVDFYTDGNSFFLGELTHCHASASQRFIPPEAETIASKTLLGPVINK